MPTRLTSMRFIPEAAAMPVTGSRSANASATRSPRMRSSVLMLLSMRARTKRAATKDCRIRTSSSSSAALTGRRSDGIRRPSCSTPRPRRPRLAPSCSPCSSPALYEYMPRGGGFGEPPHHGRALNGRHDVSLEETLRPHLFALRHPRPAHRAVVASGRDGERSPGAQSLLPWCFLQCRSHAATPPMRAFQTLASSVWRPGRQFKNLFSFEY